jgi:hypothetical protein
MAKPGTSSWCRMGLERSCLWPLLSPHHLMYDIGLQHHRQRGERPALFYSLPRSISLHPTAHDTSIQPSSVHCMIRTSFHTLRCRPLYSSRSNFSLLGVLLPARHHSTMAKLELSIPNLALPDGNKIPVVSSPSIDCPRRCH